VLSTCNRSEVYGVPPEAMRECAPGLSSFLSEFHSVKQDLLSGSLYHHYDQHAVRHLFRVSAGLDSMMLGEAEILGQVRDAYKFAQEQRATGPVLNRLFQGALEVGKRVRSETELGTRPMSVASAGVKLAERIFGKLHERVALVLGAGSVSELVVSQLRDRGIARLLVMNRSAEHAASLAKEFGGTVVPWGTWESALLTPDVVVSSVAAEEPVLCRAELERAMSARGNRALFLLDLGVPRNIEAAASELYNVYVYNLDDLSDIVRQNRSARESEIPRAELIIEEHVEKFLSWQASVDLVGVLTSLRERVTRERSEFLRERLDGLGQLTGEDRERVQEIVGELLERILIEPARQLRGERELRRKIQNVEALRDVFLNGKDKP